MKFKQPPQPTTLDEWVERDKPPAKPPVREKRARLTIDLPDSLHQRFKLACLMDRTSMVEVAVRLFEEYSQKHR